MAGLTDLPGLTPDMLDPLERLGITSVEGLAAAPVDTLLAVPGMTAEAAEALRAEARARVAVDDESTRGAKPQGPHEA